MPRPEDTPPIGESIGEIIDRTTKIVHEEIELAKAEMAVAAQNLLRGSVAGIVGGVFAFFGLFILLIGLSFFISDLIDFGLWPGFFIVAFLLFALGGLLAFIALKKIQKGGSQITPTQAIDEAKVTKDALKAEGDKTVDAVEQTIFEGTAVEETPVPPATKPPIEKDPAASEAEKVLAEANAALKEDLKGAREEADELQVDAKEAKRRAKQEAKEAKEAEKAAKKAADEAAKAEAVAAKKAEKLQAEQAKAQAKAEKEAAKAAKKAAKKGKEPEPEQPPATGQTYVAPTIQTTAVPEAPKAPPAPQTPPAPPSAQEPPPPPTDPSQPYDPSQDK